MPTPDSIFYWKGQTNFGDLISKPIMEHVLGKPLADAQINDTGKLVACGSILYSAREGDVVWGAGYHPASGDQVNWTPPPNVEYRYIRGPLTKKYLEERGVEVDCPYLDPGSLLSKVYPVEPAGERRELWVPHFGDKYGKAMVQTHGKQFGNVLADWKHLAEKIANASCVVSSALHPLIVAHSYGVPALWVKGPQPPEKYHDYFLSRGIETEPVSWWDVNQGSGYIEALRILKNLKPLPDTA